MLNYGITNDFGISSIRSSCEAIPFQGECRGAYREAKNVELLRQTTAWPFIQVNDCGIACISGTSTKVTEIAECDLAYRWDAEQLHQQLTGLSLPQIHAALGYYYEHKDECDAQLRTACEQADSLRLSSEDDELRRKVLSRLSQ